MGCKHSTTIRVQPVGAAPKDAGGKIGQEGTTQTPTQGRKNLSRESTVDEYELDEQGNKVPKKKRRRSAGKTRSNRPGSACSLDDGCSLDGDRGFSATSKKSADSGVGEGDDGEDLAALGIITEYSNSDEVQRIEDGFIEQADLDMCVTGTQLPTRLSAKDRPRQEESNILQSLREEGLIAKPAQTSAGGMSFEIVTKDAIGGSKIPSLPPMKLEKLERRRKKKKVLTEEEIKEKLERAENRRKKREADMITRLKELERTDALAALDNFQTYQKEKEQQVTQKIDVAADNREKKLKELREKMKERERRAEEVRRRKQQALEQGLVTSGIIDNSAEYPEGFQKN